MIKDLQQDEYRTDYDLDVVFLHLELCFLHSSFC